MYKLFDDFRASDENRQPYSFSVEKHTPIDNMHSWVEEDSFHMASVGNRHILNTPEFTNCEFGMKFKITYMREIKPKFMVLFGYDEELREGNGIYFEYDLQNTVTISLISIRNNYMAVLESKDTYIDLYLTEDTYYMYSLKAEKGTVSGNIAGVDFSFKVNQKAGKLAIERADFIGELIIEGVSVISSDTFESKNIIEETTVEIPMVNGGDIPYTLTWRVDEIQGEYYLTAKLDGGTKTRELNREDRPGQYVAEIDRMISPYIGIGTKDELSSNYCIARGEKVFVDPNIFWECQKNFFGDTEIPIVNTYKIPKKFICNSAEIVFGYENLLCKGYLSQEGGCEFRFTLDGKLIYSGDACDGRDVYELYSQEDKLALSFVPEDCYKREEVIEHIRYNHYFDVSEDIDFTFVMRTMTDTEYLDVKTCVLDVYESEIMGEYPVETEIGKWNYGYNQIIAKVHIPKMKIGVWKVEFKVNYGGKLYKRYVKTFEVFDCDSDTNPATASGLPFIFSMPNEQKWLMRNAFDLWTPMKSCDMIHYYNCVTDTPVEAMIRKPWDLNRKFKRKWFTWLSSRTCKDWNIENYMDVVKNCDYLFCSINEEYTDLSQGCLYPFRQDYYIYEVLMRRGRQRIEVLDEFLEQNPEIAQKADYKKGMEFTFEHFVNLMQICRAEWIEFQDKKGLELIRKQNVEIAKINPDAKRAMYGPVNIYTLPTLTSHSVRAYCNSDYEALSKEIFTGFAVFEDYPYSCAYQTYRGAFMIMTILLHSPELTIYPEQYSGSAGGCIDGAVKFAHAPMGKYSIESYQNSTHAFEFVFNTAYRLKDGYHYWNTYGFHRSDNVKIIPNMVLDWKYALDNKPKKPMMTTAFLAEYTDKEDVFEIFKASDDSRNCYIINPSESGHGFVFECTRESGIPNGFAFKYDVLPELLKDECDVIVLPNLKYAPEWAIEEIRRLYSEGVNLIAVSDISGLEDIFGVVPDERTVKINKVFYDGEEEFVRENDAKLLYKAAGADVVMSSENGEELIVKTDRTVLINTSVTNLGCADSQYMGIAKAPYITGILLRKAVNKLIKQLSTPLAVGENVGVTLFETQDNRKMLMAIDYTPFDNTEHSIKEAVVRINLDGVVNVKCDRETFTGRKNGFVREIRFDIKEHETVFIELC